MAAAASEGEQGGKPPKKKRFEMSPEHKQRLADGRAAAAAKRAEAAAAVERGDVPTPDLTTTSKPRSLLDIFQIYPIGDGKHFIQVVRTQPKRFYDQNVGGVQQPIMTTMTEAEFATFYGGASYELRVYMQDERQDGTPYSKPLTDQIVYLVPGPPNLDSAINEEDEMRYVPQNLGRSRGRMVGADRVSPFEAPPVRMRQIQSDETMDERNRAERRERDRQEREDREAREDRELRALDMVKETKDREIERMEQSKDRELQLAREAEAARAQADVARLEAQLNNNKQQPNMLEMVRATKELLGGNEASAAHMQQLIESHKNELGRLHTDHERQLAAERERSDKRIKDAETNAERRIKDAEERFDKRAREIEEAANRRISEVEQRTESRVRETERQAETRLADLDRQHNNRMTDLKDNHARELRAQESAAGLGVKQVEVTSNARISTLEAEQRRLEAENARLRRECEQYKKESEDWLGKLEKFNQQAEAMGFVRESDVEGGEGGEGGPKDWKELAAAIAMKAISNLPDMIETAGKALQAARAGGAGAQQQIQRHQMVQGVQGTIPRVMAGMQRPMLQTALPFATEDGAGYIPPMQHQPVPVNPHQAPPPHDTAPAPVVVPPPSLAQTPPPPPGQQLALVQVEPQHAPNPPPAQVAPQQAPPGEDEGAVLDPIIIGLAVQYDAKASPTDVVEMLIQAVPPDQREPLKMLTFENVVAMISTRKHEAAQKLMRREGQKFLKQVWAELQAKLAAT